MKKVLTEIFEWGVMALIVAIVVLLAIYGSKI